MDQKNRLRFEVSRVTAFLDDDPKRCRYRNPHFFLCLAFLFVIHFVDRFEQKR